MTDTTLSGLLPVPDGPSPLRTRLQNIAQITADLAKTLQAQRDLLQRRPDQFGAALSVDPLNKLQTAYQDLTRLIDKFADTSSDQEVLQLRALVRNAELINSTLELDFVLSDVVDTVVALTGAERGYILLPDPDRGELIARVARDDQQRNLEPSEFTISQSVVTQAALRAQIVVANDALNKGEFKETESVVGLKMVSILCVPLMRKGVVTGVIYTDSRLRTELFGERAQALVQAFANQAALAIENARLFEAVRASLTEIMGMRDLMANVFESIASGVITVNENGYVTTLNAAAAQILGVSATDTFGQRIGDIIPAPPDVFDWAIRRVSEAQSEHHFELDLTLASGATANLSFQLSPLRGEPGSAGAGVAIVLNDLTAEKTYVAQQSFIKRYLPPVLVDNIEVYDRAELGGDEREISVLSSDIRGFTSFSQDLDPEELMRIINIYLTISSDTIHKFGGIIDKYMGDAVVALFNTQINPQMADHAVRAVQTACILAQQVETAHHFLPDNERLFFGIGVHTGSAVIGNVGSNDRKEFTAIGDTMQLSKLLQENAGRGEVMISQQTYELVADYFEAEALTPLKTKDRTDFTVMYRVVGLKPGVTLDALVVNNA